MNLASQCFAFVAALLHVPVFCMESLWFMNPKVHRRLERARRSTPRRNSCLRSTRLLQPVPGRRHVRGSRAAPRGRRGAGGAHTRAFLLRLHVRRCRGARRFGWPIRSATGSASCSSSGAVTTKSPIDETGARRSQRFCFARSRSCSMVSGVSGPSTPRRASGMCAAGSASPNT